MSKNDILTAAEPPPHSIDVEGIAPAMLASPNWVCWVWVHEGKKWTKVPIRHDGDSASTTDPTTWSDFATVEQAASRNGVGIGYVFNGEIVGVDFDDCRDPGTGAIDAWAQDIITVLGSYTEVSPSGTGVKVFVRGEMPEKFRHQYDRPEGGSSEIYNRARFFTVTGQRVHGTPDDVLDRPKELATVLRLFQSWLPGPRPKKVQSAPRQSYPDSDDRETALCALDVLDPSASYPQWLEIGMALHSVDSSDSMLLEWENWSRVSDKFVDGECSKKWGSFRTGDVAIGTLCWLANQTGKRWRPEQKVDPVVKLSKVLGGGASEPGAGAGNGSSHAKITRMSDVQPTKLEWTWNGVIPSRKLTLFTGDPGLGKSLITLDMASRVSRGDCWPNDSTSTAQGAVILMAAEDDMADTIRPRLDAAGADSSMVYCIEGVTKYDSKTSKPQTWSFQIDRDLPILEGELQR